MICCDMLDEWEWLYCFRQISFCEFFFCIIMQFTHCKCFLPEKKVISPIFQNDIDAYGIDPNGPTPSEEWNGPINDDVPFVEVAPTRCCVPLEMHKGNIISHNWPNTWLWFQWCGHIPGSRSFDSRTSTLTFNWEQATIRLFWVAWMVSRSLQCFSQFMQLHSSLQDHCPSWCLCYCHFSSTQHVTGANHEIAKYVVNVNPFRTENWCKLDGSLKGKTRLWSTFMFNQLTSCIWYFSDPMSMKWDESNEFCISVEIKRMQKTERGSHNHHLIILCQYQQWEI